MNKSFHSNVDVPRSLAPSVEGTKSLSNLPVAVIVSDVALPRLTSPVSAVSPLTDRLSSIVVVPPAESIVRLPETVSISLSPVTPI